MFRAIIQPDNCPFHRSEENPISTTTQPRRPFFALVTAILLAVALGAVAYVALGREQAKPLPVLYNAPEFSWQNQTQQTVSTDTLRGKVVLANFIYTSCTDICPTLLTPKMLEQRDALRDAGLLGNEVVLVSFSVDPEHDTPAVLADYARRFGADAANWHLLTSSPSGGEEVQRVVVHGFRFAVQLVIDSHADHASPADTIVHGGRFVLIDRQQRVRALYDPADLTPATVISDVRQLLAEAGV